MVHKVNSGHPGGSLGCAEFLVALYKEIMDRKEGFHMDGHDEDLFFLSNGHISPVIYSVLARSGYFPIEELNTFRLLDSRLQGHPYNTRGIAWDTNCIGFTGARNVCSNWSCAGQKTKQ
jgi:transketolase